MNRGDRRRVQAITMRVALGKTAAEMCASIGAIALGYVCHRFM